MRRRSDVREAGLSVRRVALYPSHDRSTAGRLTNYGSFALSASVSGTSWLRGAEGLWVYNSPPTVGLPTWLIKARYRPRVLLHVMDMWPESVQAGGFGKLLDKSELLSRALDRWLGMTYDTADVIACTSRRQVTLLERRGVPAAKLAYVPVWPDETIFHPVERHQELAVELGVDEKFVLLYAGTLGEAQGLDSLVEACAALRDDERFHCLVAGSGVSEERLRARASALGLTNLTFLGRWPSDDMTRLMSIGHVHLVSLSRNPLAGIAMPSKLQAILASAGSVIVAAEGEAAETVVRAGAGWVCTPGDVSGLVQAIAEALAMSPGDLAKLGESGLAYYKREFSLSVGVGRVEALLTAQDRSEEDVE
jgi:glycosyltransferase involved in cell wall biosynthesis